MKDLTDLYTSSLYKKNAAYLDTCNITLVDIQVTFRAHRFWKIKIQYKLNEFSQKQTTRDFAVYENVFFNFLCKTLHNIVLIFWYLMIIISKYYDIFKISKTIARLYYKTIAEFVKLQWRWSLFVSSV